MKSTDRSACDGNEAKREYFSGKNRARSVHKARQGRHQNLWPNKENARGQNEKCSRLDEGDQVVARRQQQPHRQRRSNVAVNDQRHGKRDPAKRENLRPRQRIGHPAPSDHNKQHQRKPDNRGFQHFPWSQETKINSQEQRDDNGHGQRKRRPRRGLQRIYDYQRNHAEQNNHDRQHRELRDESSAAADLFTRHLSEGFSVAPNRAKQDDEVLYASRQRRAGNQPKSSRQVPKLRRERRPHERSWSGDRREVVA